MARKKATEEQKHARKVLVKRKRGGNSTSFKKDNPHKSTKAEENGGELDPRINQKGRPILLGNSYKELLKIECPRRYIPAELRPLVDEYRGYKGATINFAERIALGMILSASSGDIKAAKEIRDATEGMKLTTWQDEVVVLLKEGKITAEMVMLELGEDARPILIAAGTIGASSGTFTQESPRTEVPAIGDGVILDGEFRSLHQSGDEEGLQAASPS